VEVSEALTPGSFNSGGPEPSSLIEVYTYGGDGELGDG